MCRRGTLFLEKNSFSYDLLHGETSSAYDNAGSAKIYRIQMPVVKMQADQGFLRFPVSDVEYELWTGIDESEDGEIIFEYEMVPRDQMHYYDQLL